jgi:hypothetical protein
MSIEALNLCNDICQVIVYDKVYWINLLFHRGLPMIIFLARYMTTEHENQTGNMDNHGRFQE